MDAIGFEEWWELNIQVLSVSTLKDACRRAYIDGGLTIKMPIGNTGHIDNVAATLHEFIKDEPGFITIGIADDKLLAYFDMNKNSKPNYPFEIHGYDVEVVFIDGEIMI